MTRFSIEGIEAGKAFAEERGLTVFVYCEQTYVMDGGTAAYREGAPWQAGFGCSFRRSTEEEQELWEALGGPT